MFRSLKNSSLLPLLVITFIVALLFYPTLLFGRIPISADLLVGAYYPWLNSKWGYSVGVSIQNPILSDVFSQFYPWKIIIADSFRHFHLPLWNPYSFSGYPLLANLHSGALYPFNLLIILLGNLSGWSAFLIFGTFSSAITLYFFCRTLGFSRLGSTVAAITYACSGFAITWMQFATATQAMIWLPLMFTCLERFYHTQNRRFLLYLPFLTFYLITSGHFQTAIYTLLLLGLYHLYRHGTRSLIIVIASLVLGLSLSAAQLVPSFELLSQSIRIDDTYISQSNYGLLPIGQLATLLAPDFFGNPARGNHWGFGQYHETLFYAGVWAALSLIFCLYDWRHLGRSRFFLITLLFSLAFGFDTPLGRLIYTLKIPLLSTSYASRIFVITTFCFAVLSAYAIDRLPKTNFISRLRRLWPVLAFFIVLTATLLICRHILVGTFSEILTARTHIAISLRNLILPLILTFLLAICDLLARFRIFRFAILLIVSADLLIFAHRYLPFVPPALVFPSTPEISFAQTHVGSSRILVEPAEIFPANTWIPYQLKSPVGYDPLLISRYFLKFSSDVNHQDHAGVSRYLGVDNFSAADLGNYAVKYLFVIKRDSKGAIPGDVINYRIDPADWPRVFQTSTVAVLENRLAKPRARLDAASASASFTTDSSQTVSLNYSSSSPAHLILADTWYPGWTATLNNHNVPILDTFYPFRAVTVPAGSGTVTFDYLPPSFILGLDISALTLLLLNYFKPKIWS